MLSSHIPVFLIMYDLPISHMIFSNLQKGFSWMTEKLISK